MTELRVTALKRRFLSQPWATEASFPDVVGGDRGYRQSDTHRIELHAPMERVQKVLAGLLRPGRSLVSAVKFTSGKIEEVVVAEEGAEMEKKKPEPEKKDKAEAGATVAKPVIGCPQPEFERVEVRATRVLNAFLSPEQREDFERHNTFVAVGADTGHRYLVTSRHKIGSTGQVFDLDAREALCVHDWDVPAPEEMLGILVHLALPGREKYLRSLPPGH